MVDWSNNYFYCLNLIHRKDKWEKSLQEFQNIGIKAIEKFPATDGNYLPKVKNFLPGEIGIIHSYIRILQDAIRHGYDSIFIFEDDVQFVQDFPVLFQKYMKEVPSDWQIIQMGGWILPKSFLPISDHIYKPDASVLTTHALIIKKEIFQDIIDIISKYSARLDDMIASNYHRWKSYGFYPALALQRDSVSDIHGRMMYYGKEIQDSEREYEKIKQTL